MDNRVTTVIDRDRCIGCGECVRVCPRETLRMIDDKAWVTGPDSIHCGHCEAVCPTGAVSVGAISAAAVALDTVDVDDRWLPPGTGDTGELIRLMRSRRSCRNYRPDPVPLKLLKDLVKIGMTAPSGSNCQQWTFTLLPSRRAVEHLAGEVAGFFERLNRTAAKAWLRFVLRALGKTELSEYYENYHAAVAEKIADWRQTGRDWLFWGAPSAIIIGSTPGASCPTEDAMMAAQNILLGAHSLGLGTCAIGFAVAAFGRDERVKTAVNIPTAERVHAVITVGWPDEAYQRLTGRKPVTPRVFAPHPPTDRNAGPHLQE